MKIFFQSGGGHVFATNYSPGSKNVDLFKLYIGKARWKQQKTRDRDLEKPSYLERFKFLFGVFIFTNFYFLNLLLRIT